MMCDGFVLFWKRRWHLIWPLIGSYTFINSQFVSMHVKYLHNIDQCIGLGLHHHCCSGILTIRCNDIKHDFHLSDDLLLDKEVIGLSRAQHNIILTRSLSVLFYIILTQLACTQSVDHLSQLCTVPLANGYFLTPDLP